MPKELTHQFGMFGFMPAKIRIMDRNEKAEFSKVLRGARAKLLNGDGKGAAEDVREFREFLECRLNSIAAQPKEAVKRKSRLMPGDLVIVEIGDKSKTEFVDALVLAVSRKGITVRTYWGLDIENIDAHLVRRRC
jgi:hypothetical protein